MTSVANPDPWNRYHFPRSSSVSIIGLIRNPDPYQLLLDPEFVFVSNDTDPDPTKTIKN